LPVVFQRLWQDNMKRQRPPRDLIERSSKEDRGLHTLDTKSAALSGPASQCDQAHRHRTRAQTSVQSNSKGALGPKTVEIKKVELGISAIPQGRRHSAPTVSYSLESAKMEMDTVELEWVPPAGNRGRTGQFAQLRGQSKSSSPPMKPSVSPALQCHQIPTSATLDLAYTHSISTQPAASINSTKCNYAPHTASRPGTARSVSPRPTSSHKWSTLPPKSSVPVGSPLQDCLLISSSSCTGTHVQ